MTSTPQWDDVTPLHIDVDELIYDDDEPTVVSRVEKKQLTAADKLVLMLFSGVSVESLVE